MRHVAVIAAAGALLIVLARRFDFFCDDAFITLRYAKNLAEHGAPVYNLGEQVEGYTSFTWMLLAAGGALAGFALPSFVQVLGGASALFMLAATWMLWRRLYRDQELLGALVLFALALSAPVCAWALGGLETPLFAALCTLSFALGVSLPEHPQRANACGLGVVLALCILTRPEGVLVAIALAIPTGRVLLRDKRGRSAFAWVLATAVVIVGAHLAWRIVYYGYPLPNTFYVKSSGDTALLRASGVRYVALAARELGIGFVAALFLALLGAGAKRALYGERDARWRLAWTGRLLIPVYVGYIALVGGDFLDLYRFFVPLLPLSFVLIASAIADQVPPTRHRAAALSLVIALLAWHGWHQTKLTERAMQTAEPARAEHGIEPLGWTRLYALRWAALGRWIAAHAQPSDAMAVGAAGAMPYYAGIYNLDTFGLCDAWVAHHAPIVGHRPGHQRFAPRDYILSKRPVFLLIGNDYARDKPQPLRRDKAWESRGYVWTQATVDTERFGAPQRFYHYLLMRRDRAEEHRDSRWLAFAQ